MLHLGDCLTVLRTLPDNSVDACVTDPPYGLSFMGKRWDYDVPATEVWAEVLRVLKPGGHLLCFAGTRTQHRMAVRIEDAGFEIRDMLAWLYGSGFPKSHNGPWGGTALKPALEPITLARKPLIGTVSENVQQFGTGAINVDGCRVQTTDTPSGSGRRESWRDMEGRADRQPWNGGNVTPPSGRWPANLLHDGSDEVVGLFPQLGAAGRHVGRARDGSADSGSYSGGWRKDTRDIGFGDSGSAARFFYCAKASKRDRDEGLGGFALRGKNEVYGAGLNTATKLDPSLHTAESVANRPQRRNNHPTVKPTALMRWLVRLVTPPGGTVLDPFMGSGSTGKACALEGFAFIGIEREAEYLEIARARIAHATPDEDTEDTREPMLPLEEAV